MNKNEERKGISCLSACALSGAALFHQGTADEAGHEDAVDLVLSLMKANPDDPIPRVGTGRETSRAPRRRTKLRTQAGGMNLTLNAFRRYSGDPR